MPIDEVLGLRSYFLGFGGNGGGGGVDVGVWASGV